MTKLIALYKKPADPDAFLRHYFERHLPLVAKTPGLEKIEIHRVQAALYGDGGDMFLIAEMTYRDRAAFDAAMASPENKAAGKDLMSFAKDVATLLVAEENDSYAAQ